MECMKKHTESGGKGDGKGDHEEVCVKEAKACAADKECSTLHAKLLHYKLQEAKKGGKDGDYGGKGGDGKYDDKKEGGYGGNDDKKESYNKGDKKGRQLAGHGDHSHDKKDDDKKKDMDGKKENMDKKKEEYGDKKDKEPSAELKAAAKACTENKLCKQLMECMKKHTESGGKGDGKGDHEEVCVKEAKACAADKECSTLHEKLQAAMKKDGGY